MTQKDLLQESFTTLHHTVQLESTTGDHENHLESSCEYEFYFSSNTKVSNAEDRGK